ncbi:hypothetical protein [Intrasporangium sp.]|uniref:hypothetical protein n=1 Tax=Intrasporangium sp. TaxID=1925024 RepID=UPI003365625A
MDLPGHPPEAADELDPAVEARIRELLAAAPGPGPMPEHVTQRIESLLSDEVALRVDPGPLNRSTPDQAIVAPLIRQRQRPRPVLAVAAVAAAAAVVAVGGSALHLSKRANGTASVGGSSVTMTPSATSPFRPNFHVQLSDTAYTEANLAGQARAMLRSPDAPIETLAAEGPKLGPIATEIGLESCLTAHSLPTDVPVYVDLATFEGSPAAVIVVTEGGRSTVRVVERTCTLGHPAPLAGATPVP